MSTFLWANNQVTFNVGVFIAASSALIHACIEHQQHHQLQQSSLAIITSYHSNGLLVRVTRVMLLNSACSMSAVLSFYCRIVHQCRPIRINLPDVHYEHGHHLPVEHMCIHQCTLSSLMMCISHLPTVAKLSLGGSKQCASMLCFRYE